MMYKKILVTAALLSFLAGCELAPEDDGEVTIYVSLQRENARTVGPVKSDIDELIAQAVRYELYGKKSGSDEKSALIGKFGSDFKSSTGSLKAKTGTWDFHLKAYKANTSASFLQGTLNSHAISSSGGGHLAFSLYPVIVSGSGTGAIDITIKIPPVNGLGISSVDAVYADTGGNAGSTELTGDTVSYKRERISAGYYFLSFKLKDGDGTVRATVTEMVQVAAGLTSSKTIILEPKDFSSALPEGTLLEKLDWLKTNALSGRSYTIMVNDDETIGPQDLFYSGSPNITLTLTGSYLMRTITLSATGSLFRIKNGVTLIVDKNVTLEGRMNNSSGYPVVYVDLGGSLVMYEGSKITGNSTNQGGGVLVRGTFTMNGGEISGNTATSAGGGVFVYGDTAAGGTSGTFIMNGGEISGNKSNGNGGGVASGTGVAATMPAFTMNGGKISRNTAGNASSGVGNGGGVYIANLGALRMSGGEISDNTSGTSSSSGGGVYIGGVAATFRMSGGKISRNTSTSTGGGVDNRGTFTMTSGEISGNTAKTTGGGVHTQSSFTMSSGKIAGNTATTSGGGVYFTTAGDFTMHNGEISGNTAGDNGGGVYVPASKTFMMYKGKIAGNTTAKNGGAVYVLSGGTFTMSGEISGNTATDNGGGVYNAGKFYMGDGIIYGNNAAAGLRNTAATGAALDTSSAGATDAQSGILYSNNSFQGYDILTTSHNTLRVVDGDLFE